MNKYQEITSRVEGYKQHNPYYEHVKELYESLSQIRANYNDSERFKKIIEMMRELIDNTYPYHKLKKVYVGVDENKKPVYYGFVVYFEYLVDLYYSAEKLNQENRQLQPGEIETLSKIKDKVMDGFRYLRREIMDCLSENEVIPRAVKQNPLLSELADDPEKKIKLQALEKGGLI